jgi:outer membrane protein assembly factor BamB
MSAPPAWAVVLGLAAAPPAPAPGPPAAAPAAFSALPAEQWRVELPGQPFPAATHTELGGPVIHGGHIFVGRASTDALFVLDRRSGREVRRIPTAAPVQSQPVVVDGRLLFADLSGRIQVWDLAAAVDPSGGGAPLWQKEGSAPVLSPPTVVDGAVYVSNVADVVIALSLADGALLWRHAQRLDASRSTELELYGAPPPQYVESPEGPQLIVGFTDGALAGLSAAEGEVLWQRRVGEGQYPDILGRALTVGEDVVVAGFTEPLVALHRGTRNVRWRVDVGGAQEAVLGGGSGARPERGAGPGPHGFVFHGGVDGKLRCVDARTGGVVWTWDSETGTALTRPVPTEAGLLVGASGGGLYLVDPVDGAARWTWSPGFHPAGITSAPAVDGRQAVAVTNAGNIVSFIIPRDEPPPGDGPFGRVPDPGGRRGR